MMLACICGGTVETFLICLGVGGAIRLVHWLRKKFKKCACCKGHAEEHKE